MKKRRVIAIIDKSYITNYCATNKYEDQNELTLYNWNLSVMWLSIQISSDGYELAQKNPNPFDNAWKTHEKSHLTNF